MVDEGVGKMPTTELLKHGNTLFVTSIPFSVTNTDLETFFSDIGPLRRAFVVTDKETHTSKGVGYVTYTDSNDAEKALEKLQGTSIDGSQRKIQLQWADRKNASSKTGNDSVTNDGQTRKRPRSSTLPDRDPDAVRTIVISGLASCSPKADEKTLYKRVRKLGDVEQVLFADKSESPCDVAYVRFRTPNHAMMAIPKLHAHQFKGAQLSVELKKKIDAAMRRDLHMREDTRKRQKIVQEKIEKLSGSTWSSKAGKLSRESRLIVRNLPFDMTVDDLRAVFLPYGALYDVSIPLQEPKNEDQFPKSRGFAFVWFVSKSDATNAMTAINGVSLRHGAAEQSALRRAKGKKGRELAKEAFERVQEHAQPARPVAVDWSVSQKDWLAQEQEQSSDNDVDENDLDVYSNDRTVSASSEQDGETEESNQESDDDADDDDDDNISVDTPAEPPKLATPEAGTTLFIRNLPYQATEAELKELFRSFGPLRYARITMDLSTNRSRGTGFVCFWNRDSADAVLREAAIVANETAATELESSLPKTNPFTVPSVITADPSAPLVSKFSLHGRVLNVVRAVTRDTASHLEDSARRAREKGDRRNTWLLREGVPFPTSPLVHNLSEIEIEKRMKSFSIRRAQLSANPSLHVSKTRLAVHQLPLFVSDKVLKRLALHAVRAFQEEVKSGNRSDLSVDEKEDTSNSSSAKQNATGKKRPPPSIVVQSKVVRQNERIDPLTGRGRSRGYGFLEMRSFQHALKVLRWANGNKKVSELLIQWWREDLKSEKDKLDAEGSSEAKLRSKRISSALDTLESSSKSEARGVLRIEFSIENITTVRKRVLRQEQARDKASKRRKISEEYRDDAASSKLAEQKQQAVRANTSKTVSKEKPKFSMGSLIGKKRAIRKRKQAN
ncbi:Similar to S.cerevisiae protein NOP4 (Nucleolar protein) [Malassezia sympodialis ATCC 42132]|uniref:Similar to S.cerevisiae protein NOP4 (Nucleolar protein) n=1 Tax=Malassezia sympodialis (strain ATCC 42132) TaxID=1230383 RepID=A0A1M8A203_MALS4|nr:Similar to S.cerevisiae protein NOP4 (Nucleolar protein) [Malassezia sympodialis ATCC 42132]